MLSFLLSTAILGLATAGAQAPQEEGDPIVVTGTPPERNPRGGVEAPYPETERVPLGSRIARTVERRPFRSVATESGLAGLVGASGDANWDGTGGSGHAFRTRRVTECTADHDDVSEAVACALYQVKRNTELGEFEIAAAKLQPLLSRRQLTSWERYYIGYYAYRLAEAAQDPDARRHALGVMVASGRMSAADRQRALRFLGDRAAERQ